MEKSSRKKSSGKDNQKPKKPYPEFPLSPANNGRWQKRINGRLYYFGKWGKVVAGVMTRIQEDGSWEEALRIYKAQVDHVHLTGEKPDPNQPAGGLTIASLCNQFLSAKLNAMRAGDLSPRTFAAYRAATDLLYGVFGKARKVESLAPKDFGKLRAKMAETWGPVRIATEIVRVKTVFNFAAENELIKEPVKYGTMFKKPSAKALEEHRNASGEKMFEASEVRAMIAKASVPLRAMILLAINCGFGNTDVSDVPQSAIDLDDGWIKFPRPKTAAKRKAKLWPETVDALRKAIAGRPSPKNEAHADRVFITRFGEAWVRMVLKEEKEGVPVMAPQDSVAVEFKKILKEIGVTGGFYHLRHSFRTVADDTLDLNAVRLVMGHKDNSVDQKYIERLPEARLIAVADHVHQWLFPKAETAPKDEKPAKVLAPRKPRAKADDTADERPTLRLFAGEVA